VGGDQKEEEQPERGVARPKSVKFDITTHEAKEELFSPAAVEAAANAQGIGKKGPDTLDEIEEFLNVVHQQRQQWYACA
jgi:hypothetical protein